MDAPIFQSWADIVIMAILAIAYIITAIAQTKTIKAKNETIAALKQQIEAAKNISDMQVSHFSMYKEMIKLDDIQQHISIQVNVRLDEVIKQVTADYIRDNSVLDKAIEIVSKENWDMMFGFYTFMMNVIYKNKMTDEQIQLLVNHFFPKSPHLYDIIKKNMLPYPTHISEPEKQKDQI